ncbi:MAG TPA: hypothetical protein EYN66_07345 [Myxococcales bacterium]|nr:hypothetical protein [Myxococcales bacterium]
MRTFDLRCHNCGDIYDVPLDAPTGRIKAISADEWTPKCPDCGDPVSIIIPAVLTVGPLESKPIDLMKSVGRKFTTNSEWREYQKKNPNSRPVSITDQSWKDHYSDVRELAETRAQKQGYRGYYDKCERRKKEKIAEGKLKP